jgi:hypothetical protein
MQLAAPSVQLSNSTGAGVLIPTTIKRKSILDNMMSYAYPKYSNHSNAIGKYYSLEQQPGEFVA